MRLIHYAGWGYRRPTRGLTPRQEVLLSYLTGLAPVGEPLEIDKTVLMADLEIGNRVSYYKFINALIANGFIRRVACGRQQSTGVFVVLKRLEAAQ